MAYIGSQAYAFGQTVALDVPSIAANTISAETFTVSGLRADGGPVRVEKRTSNTGLVAMDARVSDDDELEITFWNTTGAAINPDSQTFYIVQL